MIAIALNVTADGTMSFNPGGDFGLVGTFFDFGPRDVWSEDGLNTWNTEVQKILDMPSI